MRIVYITTILGKGAHPPCAAASLARWRTVTRIARRVRLGCPGGPDLRQALERPPLPGTDRTAAVALDGTTVARRAVSGQRCSALPIPPIQPS